MHHQGHGHDVLTQAVVRTAVARLRLDPPPLDGPCSPTELRAMAGETITADGIGGLEALRIFDEVLARACISIDHPRFLAFVPAAPTEAATLFDLLVGACSIYGGSWMEGAGAVYAENQALRWLADLAGLPPTSGGVFVSGGTIGNLSALTAARYAWREGDPERARRRGLIVAGGGAHSSIASAARVMDADIVRVPVDDRGRTGAEALQATIDALDPADAARVFAVVVTAGTTNVGVVDDIGAAADIAEALGVWLHVDAAYGGAALAAPSVRHHFNGIELADSFIVDPHKWLFAPFDCCALLYRDPLVARRAHTQHAEYLDVLHDPADADWNPSDFAIHLSRRPRGLPFWFSLATYGTRRYSEAIEASIALARESAAIIKGEQHLELILEPELSVVMFRRVGWSHDQYNEWSDAMLAKGDSFVVPTAWRGETVLRFCFVNPRTTLDDVEAIVASLV